MGAYVPVRAPRASAGPRGALVPVRLDPLVPVPDTNRDVWASIHWSRFVAGTGTKGWPLVPVPAKNRDQWMTFRLPALRLPAIRPEAVSFPMRVRPPTIGPGS